MRKIGLKNRSEKLEFPNVDRLDAENAQIWPENLIPHAEIFIMTDLGANPPTGSPEKGNNRWAIIIIIIPDLRTFLGPSRTFKAF